MRHHLRVRSFESGRRPDDTSFASASVVRSRSVLRADRPASGPVAFEAGMHPARLEVLMGGGARAALEGYLGTTGEHFQQRELGNLISSRGLAPGGAALPPGIEVLCS